MAWRETYTEMKRKPISFNILGEHMGLREGQTPLALTDLWTTQVQSDGQSCKLILMAQSYENEMSKSCQVES